MAILQFNVSFPGQQVKPRFGHLLTDDDLADVVVAGYLNPYIISHGLNVEPTDFIFVSAADGHQIYKPVFNADIITLTVLP